MQTCLCGYEADTAWQKHLAQTHVPSEGIEHPGCGLPIACELAYLGLHQLAPFDDECLATVCVGQYLVCGAHRWVAERATAFSGTPTAIWDRGQTPS